MLRIGYVRLRDADPTGETAALKALGCQVVRAEEPGALDGDEYAVLDSILEFIGEGDQLVVVRLDQLASSGRGMLRVLERLDAHRASLFVAEPQLSSNGPDGRALRAALEAVAAVEPVGSTRRGRPAATHEIRALQRAGVGPVEIARRLGVSRMTVWRKLRSSETCS